MITALLLSFAFATAPDGIVEAFDAGGVTVDALTVSDDGGLVMASHRDGLWVLDTETWQTATWSGCGVAGAAAQRTDAGVYTVWVACDDGAVSAVEYAQGVLTEDVGAAVDLVTAAAGVAAFWDATGERLYVLTEESADGALVAHVVEPAASVVDPTGYPVRFVRSGYEDAVLTTTRILVSHGGDDMSSLTLGSTVPATNTTPTSYGVVDLAPSMRDTAYAGDRNGAVLEYQVGTGSWGIVTTDPGGSVRAVGASRVAGDEWLMVARGGDVVNTYELSSGSLTSAVPVSTFDAGGLLGDIVVGPEGYAFAARDPGEVVVMTANPWITGMSAAPGTATLGDTVEVSFAVDDAVDWELRLGSATGTLVDSGSTTEAANVVSVVTVDAGWSEGANTLVVVATDAVGARGTAGVTVSVDSAPPMIVLVDGDVSFSSGSLTLNVPGIDAADVERVDVYVTVTDFDPTTFSSGGPAFDGDDALETPVTGAITAGVATTIVVSPLTDGQVYYIAARAIDAGGREGPMSVVVTGTPRRTYSASEIAGDDGGPACSVLGFGVMGVGVIAVPFAALGLPWLLPMVPGRRRRTGPIALLAACIIGGAANTAKAELPTDETPAWWNIEMRYGSMNLDDQGLRDTYGASGHDLFQVEIGPQLWRFFELDAGFAYSRDVATTLDANGQPSGTESRYTLAPLTLDATFRLHVLDEQPFVPFVRAGMDYVIWNEAWQAGATTDRNRGAKGGYHYGFGGQILLDTFNRRRASILEAGTGINDTWVTLEWRRQRVEPGKVLFFNNSEGTSFSSTVLSIGLKLDY